MCFKDKAQDISDNFSPKILNLVTFFFARTDIEYLLPPVNSKENLYIHED
jgi:hypothetical protein